MRIAAIIVGIDGWAQYTFPLMESLRKWESNIDIVIVDNHSGEPYPLIRDLNTHVTRTFRLCYSAAINIGKAICHDADWYIVLSNDVLCNGPFAHILEEYGDGDVVGPLLLETPIPNMGMIPYLEGWCVCVPRIIWDSVGGWDEEYQASSFEDVDLSQSAREKGFGLVEDRSLPFTHLNQRQRFFLPGYSGTEAHNMAYFARKHARVTA